MGKTTGKVEHKIFNPAIECISRDELIAMQGQRLREVVRRVFLGKRQHVVGHRHASRRTPDSAAHAGPVARAKLVADRAQAVVARMPAAELHANRARVDIELVVDDDKAIG